MNATGDESVVTAGEKLRIYSWVPLQDTIDIDCTRAGTESIKATSPTIYYHTTIYADSNHHEPSRFILSIEEETQAPGHRGKTQIGQDIGRY